MLAHSVVVVMYIKVINLLQNETKKIKADFGVSY